MSSVIFHFKPKAKPTPLNTLDEATEAMKTGGFVWLDFSQPTPELLQPLIDKLGIHPLSIEDCLDDNQIPKMDIFPNNTFILFNNFIYEKQELAIEEIDLIIAPSYLVTVHSRNSKKTGFFDKLPERIERVISVAGKGTDFLMHTVMDYVVDNKFIAIETLQDEIDQMEEKVHEMSEKFKPMELMRYRGYLLALRKSLFHEREILVKICRKDSPFISEKSIFYFRDIYDHLTKSFEFIEINREMIGNLFELYLSMRGNHLAAISLQMNEAMKRLTLITTVFMPLTLLAGVGGMSEWSMMTGSENWAISYPAFLLGMAVLAWLNYKLLKWIRWV